MKMIKNYVIVSFCGILLLSCEKNNKDSIIKDFSHSNCIINQKNIIAQESIHFKMLNEHKLQVEHLNTFFSCNPGKITVSGEITNYDNPLCD